MQLCTGQWYTKVSVDDLIDAVPDFDWILYLNTIGPKVFNGSDLVVVYALPYLQKLGIVITNTDIRLILTIQFIKIFYVIILNPSN